ncbi:helix-turn-helix domain-containing protein [Moellerella wisconsensis]|uniref:helix-turn-helix domain-containing protein n=1 Tax=Moellerella wisconsensis TaxID=158849 RepID=UPI000640D080|nr:helix-turn-helix domain-containing protein [Moellerella wisconsensis]KLN97312.1 transcriptional regulator [Moellerella wisconsensis]
MKNKAIEKAIDIAGGQKKLAILCGVSQPTVWRWLHGGGVDAKLVMSVVKATNNAVLPHEIRPDLYELIGTSQNKR